MSKSRRKYEKNEHRRIRVAGQRHDPPDPVRLSRALLAHAKEMAAAQAEADAELVAHARSRRNVAAQQEANK